MRPPSGGWLCSFGRRKIATAVKTKTTELGDSRVRVAAVYPVSDVGQVLAGWHRALNDHLAQLVGAVSAALLIQDPAVLADAVTWLRSVMAHRGAPEDVVLACLLHDVVQELIRSDHGYWGAQLFEPYVPERTSFAIKYHQALRFYAAAAGSLRRPRQLRP